VELLNSIGEKPGKPLIVQEREYSVYAGDKNLFRGNISTGFYVDGIKMRNIPKSSIEQNSDDIEIEKIKVQSAIYVKFEIK
jgi:hypothetical protein